MVGGVHPAGAVRPRASPRQWLCCAIVLAVLGIAPDPAGAAKLGTPHFNYGDTDGGVGCGPPSATCIFMQRKLPDTTLRAPFNGRVVKWRLATQHTTSFQLVVMRPEGGGSFKLVRASESEPVPGAGAHSFETDVRIRKGDRVGVFGPGLSYVADPTSDFEIFNPPPIIGGSDEPDGGGANELLYNATIRR